MIGFWVAVISVCIWLAWVVFVVFDLVCGLVCLLRVGLDVLG